MPVKNFEEKDMLIRKILARLFTATQVKIIDLDYSPDRSFSLDSVLEEVIDLRETGDRRPVIIYGFDRLHQVRNCKGVHVLDLPGVFYLQLPCRIENINKILQKAQNPASDNENFLEERQLLQYAIGKARAYAHTCDNVCMVMEGNIKNARKSFDSKPDVFPEALTDFRPERMERLKTKYGELEPLMLRLGIKGAENIPDILSNAVHNAEGISIAKMPGEALLLAKRCEKAMREVVKIMSAVKERYHDR